MAIFWRLPRAAAADEQETAAEDPEMVLDIGEAAPLLPFSAVMSHWIRVPLIMQDSTENGH